MAESVLVGDVTGKTIVITGASAGIGAAAARRLARAGARVFVIGRCPDRTGAVAADAGAQHVVADFARLNDVRAAAEHILANCDRIDILANNAGAVFPHRAITDDGHETTFQVNHLAGFLLTELLLPRLRLSTDGARIITTSSLGNRFSRIDLDDLQRERRRYGNGWLAYCASKLMNIMYTRQLASEVAGDGIDAVCFHPAPGRNGEPIDRSSVDATHTNFAEDTRIMRLFHRVPGLRNRQLSGAVGAQPLVWLASAPQVVSGAYYTTA
jgi:NAD(P)-dependent dehydrogenase (short-subunit alcohol dehydrogenase family)